MANTALLAAIAKAAIVVIATGGLTTLTTYQQVGKWTPALVSGGTAACSVILAQLGVSGAVASAKSVSQPKPVPPV